MTGTGFNLIYITVGIMTYYRTWHITNIGEVRSRSAVRCADAGFTLVELITVCAILAILAAISIPAYNGYIQKVRIARTIAEIRMLEKSLYLYKTDKETLPDTLSDIGYGGLLDPWKHPYQYLNIESGGIKGKGKLRRDRFLNPLNTDFDLYSMGADGDTKTNLNSKESQDDVVRVMNGSFIGLAADF